MLESEDEVVAMERRIAGHGYYSVRINRDVMAALRAGPDKVDRLFQERMQATLGLDGPRGGKVSRHAHPVSCLPGKR